MKRPVIVSGVAVVLFGLATVANPAQTAPSANDRATACATMMSSEGITAEGHREMERFMHSERMPQAMTAMMEMARQIGNGDPMAGMVRMMEMMSMMGPMGGMMGPAHPQSSK